MSAIPSAFRHLATESSQATFLTASTPEHPLCDNLSSRPGQHAEDRLIDEVLPQAAQAGKLIPNQDNHLFIGINRSPCAADLLNNGNPSCDKPGGVPCAQRILDLVSNGFSHGGQHYPVTINLDIRDIYGANGRKEANSVQALHQLTATGRVEVNSQQLGGPASTFRHTAAAKLLP